MIDLKNRSILNDGTVICNQTAMIEMLYAEKPLSMVYCADVLDEAEWTIATKECDVDLAGPMYAINEQYQGVDWFSYWLTPEPWASIDLLQWCLDRCSSSEEIDRIHEEIAAFESRNMIPIMKHLIYCVDVWRKNNIVWGVGRGSSVCSLVLYLIGINRINPIEYQLELSEWLK